MKGGRKTNRAYGLLGLITISLVILKTTGAIGWGWAWVLAPLWLPVAAIVAVVFVLEAVKAYKNYDRRNKP